jgi:N-acetylneuraminic acid mutarotase
VTGGISDNGRLDSVEKYSPSTDTWIAMAPLPEARRNHTAVVLGSNIYLLGGYVGTFAAQSMLKYDSIQGI